MKSLSLREHVCFVEPLASTSSSDSDPPRALRSLASVLKNELCHRCGTCIGICPTGALGVDKEGFPEVANLSACTDCDLCVRVCPGDEFRAQQMAEDLFAKVLDIRDMHGYFQSAFIGHASDEMLREESTSGGVITALLIALLESKEIDGAVVVGSDNKELWKGAPMVARTKEELLSTMKSKYAISPTNVVLSELRKQKGRYAVVGLPCQIHGIRKAMALDKRLKDSIVLTIGLFCHAAVEHEPMEYIWKGLGESRKRAVRFISRVGKHPGTPHLELEDGSLQPVYFPKASGYRPSSMEIINILYRLYTPPRCLTCYDATSEFADISVGDPWMAPPSDDIDFREGYSFALVRTKRGEELLSFAEKKGELKLIGIDPSAARACNKMMGEEKRWRAFRVMKARFRQGLAIPEYGFEAPRAFGMQKLKTELNLLSHSLCFMPRLRKVVLRLTFSKLGYLLLWANSKRRQFRIWQRDQRARRERAR